MSSLIAILLTFFLLLSKANLATEIFRFDLIDPTPQTYRDFLESIRQEVRDPTISYGGTNIPVIGPPTNTFLRIDLVLQTGMVSLAMLRNDLYIMGYMAMNQREEYVIHMFFDKIKEPQLRNLFPEVIFPRNSKVIQDYNENYDSIQGHSGYRKQVGLGINKLAYSAENVNKKARDVRSEAKFMLLSVEMISECARFKYIEDCIVSNFFIGGFTPDNEVFALIENWGEISKQVKKSDKGILKDPLILTCRESSSPWVVNDIQVLKLGLLKFCPDEDERGKRETRNEGRYDEIDSGGSQQRSKKDHGRDKQNLCDRGLGYVLTKNNGNKGGRSRGVCSFSTNLAIIVPRTLVAQELTSLDILWYYLVVIAVNGATGMLLLLVYQAYSLRTRGQSKFSNKKVVNLRHSKQPMISVVLQLLQTCEEVFASDEAGDVPSPDDVERLCHVLGIVCMLVEQRGQQLCELQGQKANSKAKRNRKRSKKPMISVVQQLLQTFKEFFASGEAKYPSSPDDVERLRQVLECIKPEDVGLTQEMPLFRKIEMIHYLNVYACDKFLIGTCCLPPSGVIPLHNHPGMTVFRKLLLGSMHIKSYAWQADATYNTTEIISPSQMVALPPPGARLAEILTDAVFTGPCNLATLYPAAGGNMHSFPAVTSCALLDVFRPCYNDAYYRDIQFPCNLGGWTMLENRNRDKTKKKYISGCLSI